MARPTAYELQNYREAYKAKFNEDFSGTDAYIQMLYHQAPTSTPDEENAWIVDMMREGTN